MPLPLAEMLAHITELSRLHEIHVEYEDVPRIKIPNEDFMSPQAFCCTEHGTVVACPVVDEESYYVVLHEMGHIVKEKEHHFQEIKEITTQLGAIALLLDDRKLYTTSYAMYGKAVLMSEAYAHAWAAEVAIEFTPVMITTSYRAFMTYLKKYGDKNDPFGEISRAFGDKNPERSPGQDR